MRASIFLIDPSLESREVPSHARGWGQQLWLRCFATPGRFVRRVGWELCSQALFGDEGDAMPAEVCTTCFVRGWMCIYLFLMRCGLCSYSRKGGIVGCSVGLRF